MFWLLFGTTLLYCLVIPGNSESIDAGVYQIGAGIADITGPAADIIMMGYAKMSQVSSGIHIRQYSRAFVISDGKNRVVFVNADVGMASQIVKIEVARRLQEKYPGLYATENVCISGTHTHSTPGGFLQYVLYAISVEGFFKQTFDAQVEGILKSIDKAHENMKSGYIYWNKGDLLDASINRSPFSYEQNPAEERKKYEYDTDKEMFLLKFTDLQNNPIGMINWFPVHCTSMNNTNGLISGDNKGYASQRFESEMNPTYLPGKGPFVAAFAQSNEGDVSPNILGPKCAISGLTCDPVSSKCVGKNERCIASGPGKDMFESAQIIGERQYEKAKELFDSAINKVEGPIKFIHQHVDMTNILVDPSTNSTTCKPAMGYSFAAGTIDGEGEFNFEQGTTTPNLFWNLVRDAVKKPSKELVKCQEPKPILLPTGEMTFPYAWQPDIVATQIFKIGSIVVAAVPGEFTTMSGRRMKEQLKKVFNQYTVTKVEEIIIAGLSNTYSSYIATFEEYQVQRYEAASTIYGPHTLQAYINQYTALAKALILTQETLPGPEPPNLLSKQISFRPGVIFDGKPFFKSFGDVLVDTESEYTAGETVEVTFVSGHPRNDLKLEDTFLTVENLNQNTHSWDKVATDSNWETRFYWTRTSTILGQSNSRITWTIPQNATPGTYRICHSGHSKNIFQTVSPYSGCSSRFTVKV